MGRYLIPGATSTAECADYNAMPGRVWEHVEGGVLVTSETEDDATLAAAYAGFTPTATDEVNYRSLAPILRTHLGHLRDFRDLVRGGGTPTAAQAYHVMADIIDYIRLSEDRL